MSEIVATVRITGAVIALLLAMNLGYFSLRECVKENGGVRLNVLALGVLWTGMSSWAFFRLLIG